MVADDQGHPEGDEQAERVRLLQLRLSRDNEGAIEGTVGPPEGPQRDFTGWLGLLALLERTVTQPLD